MILALFPSARAEVIAGVTTATTGIVGHISWANDVFPIITEIAVIAGAIVATHGVYVIIKDKIIEWRNKRKNYIPIKDKIIEWTNKDK